MCKKRILGSLILIVVMGAVLGFCGLLCFAEDITITTYYPAPFGVYNEMRANRLIVGDPDSVSTPAPSFDGGLTFNGAAPTGADTFEEGTMYYDSTNNVFKYSPDGIAWQNLSSGALGQSVMYLRRFWADGAPAACPAGWSSADYGRVIFGTGKNNVRTCYRTDQTCQVMYLRRFEPDGAPAACPAGWSSADYGRVIFGTGKNNVRTCYLCH